MPASSNSWVTTVYDEQTCLPALVLAKCLRKVLTTADIVVLIPENLPESVKLLLSEFFDAVLEFTGLNQNTANSKILLESKIFAWSLMMYKKCIVLDPSIIILKNCDELFGSVGELSMLRSTQNSSEWGAPLIILQPLYQNFICLKKILSNESPGKKMSLLEVIKNALPKTEIKTVGSEIMEMVGPSNDRSIGARAKMWNFSNTKPWLTIEQNQQNIDANEIWMKIFTEEVIPCISTKEVSQISPFTAMTNTFDNLDTTKCHGLGIRSKSYHNELKESIAIIGQSCRLPGANSVDEFWELLESGGDGITPIPLERLQEHQSCDPRFTSIKAGFLKCPIDEFDAKFFGISPREAAYMDPQQRLLVEVAWEALEDAALNPVTLKGSNTGVFSGVWTHEYERLLTENTTGRDFHHVVLGNAFSATSARVSYFLGLNGPNVATESGCSSSMVALHLACDSLRKRETDLALATGVNLLIDHFPHSEVSILAKDGHCKTFDEKADGFARAEGVVVVVLKRLSDAVRDGDRIISIVRGSALSNEGTTTSFGTPSKYCQEIAIKDALKVAGVKPEEVDYVEAHGTGTPIGDPIEFAAISAGYKAQREKPLIIGSVKTNTGHTESAAGLAGLLKVNLAMQNQCIPPHRNLSSVNPNIDLHALPAHIPLEPMTWNRNPQRKRLAAVSSFGISGTNVHVILQEPPIIPPIQFQSINQDRTHHFLALSAKTENALKDLAQSYVAYLKTHPELSIHNICYTSNLGRQHFKHRVGLVVKDITEMQQKLEKPDIVAETLANEKSKIAFLFTGQGSQYSSMAKMLYETNLAFQDGLNSCNAILKNNVGISINEILFSTNDSKLDDTIYSQITIFCVEYSLLKLWESIGIKPDYVLGHSVGEFAASVVAGFMSLEEALILVAARSRLIHNLPVGGMLAIRTNAENVKNLIQSYCLNNSRDWLDIAVVNSPEEVVVAGKQPALKRFAEFCVDKNIKSQFLAASHAFHSRDMEVMLTEFGKTADNIKFKTPTCNYVSGSTGKHLHAGDMDSKYWQNHARYTVDFTQGIKLVHKEGCNIFIEIGAHPILLALGMSNLPALEIQNCLWLPSIRRNEDNWVTFFGSVSRLYVNGVDVDWKSFESDCGREKVVLPHYPFQRQKYWIESKSEPITRPLHPLLGRKIPLAVSKDHVFLNTLHLNDFSYLIDHQVANVIIMPGAGFLEIILAAAKEALKDNSKHLNILVEDFVVEAPMALEEDKTHKIQVVASEIVGSEKLIIQVFWYKSLNGYNDEKGWKQFSSATVSSQSVRKDVCSLSEARLRCVEEFSPELFYEKTAEVGIRFGETFQSIAKLWKGTDEVIAEIPCPTKVGSLKEYVLHPIVLDAMIQAAGLSSGQSSSDLHLPVGIASVSIYSNNPNSQMLYAHAFKNDSKLVVQLWDEKLNLLCVMKEIHLVKTSIGSFMNAICAQKNQLPGLYQEIWRPRVSHLHARVDLYLLPDITFVAREVTERMREGMTSYETITESNILAEKSVRVLILITFHELGWRPKLGDQISVRAFMADLLISPSHSMLVERLLAILEEDRFLKRISENQESEWILSKLPDSIKNLRTELEGLKSHAGRLGDYTPERHILYHCGDKMAEILLGQISGVEVLFGNDDPDINPLVIFTKGKSANMANLRARFFLESKFGSIKPNGSILRILEIGAGSGATSKEILNGLQSKAIQYRYTFTDISPAFFEEAKKQLRNISSIDYKVLNIENDPKYQGFIPNSYDVIIAANVIHATENISNSLKNIRQLLATNGSFVLQEMLKPIRLIDFVYGTVEGYWRFKDFDIRTHHPCIDETVWKKVLSHNGFKNTHLISEQREFSSILVSEAADILPTSLINRPLHKEIKCSLWLIFSNLDDGISCTLQNMLENSGDRAMLIFDKSFQSERENTDYQFVDYFDEESISNFLTTVQASFKVQGIVVLLGLDAPDAKQKFCQTSLSILKYFSTSSSSCKIIMVTRGVYNIADQGNMSPSHATMWGIFKAFQMERQDFEGTLIDLDPDNINNLQDTEQLFAEIWLQDFKLVAYRNNKRNVLKFVKLQTLSFPLDLPNGRYEIVIPVSKKVNDITYKSTNPNALQPEEVEICVKAVALNFRDIFTILKPEMFFTKFDAIGTDVSGVITKLGESVSKYKIGDEVFGICKNSAVASHVIVNSNLILHKPKQFSFAESCTLPSVFLTAYHCLVTVANLRSCETILIHVASGGVGLVAIQIAKSVGANIIATAGNKRKRAYLKSLGIQHVFHSRDLSFGEKINEVTNGGGVNMVLNSLTGTGFKETSLNACAKNARFVEMGKVNIWQPGDVQKLRTDVEYTIVNLEMVDDMEMRTLMTAMSRIVANQTITPLPYIRFSASQIKDALNYFLKAQHIGKVVVCMPEIKESLGKQFKSDLLFNTNGTYLVTGGLGGIGLEVAKWMVKCGAMNVVLVGRSVPNEKTLQVLRDLSCKGVKVLSRQVDVGDLEQCKNLFAIIRAEMPPLRGVIHSAGALSDGMIRNQNWTKFETVFNAKVKGGWNLHHLTKDISLEHFVLFSSLAALVGPLGQSNHSAANTFLDSLAFYRHSLGLPAQTINWGAWSEVGAATNTTFGKEGALGLKPFSPSQGIAALQFTMSQPIVQIAIAQFDPAEFCETHPNALAYFSEILDGQDKNEAKLNAQGEKFWIDVERLTENDRYSYIKTCIESIIRVTLKLPESEAFDEHQTFSEMGLDSLMAVEMRNKLQQMFGKHLVLNPTSLLDYPNLASLSKYLAQLTMTVDIKSNVKAITETDNKTIAKLSTSDSILPENIVAPSVPVRPSEIKSILITGVTGHFGPHLLKQLVEISNVKIVCLIRAKSVDLAEKRLKANIQKFELSISLRNVTIILGDITESNLGMKSEIYEQWAKITDAVFHCAVKANHIEQYKDSKSGKDIRSVNVLGTMRVLEFASAFNTKRVAFLSSYTAANVLNESGVISEDLPTEENKGKGLDTGYPLTKFVGEKLMNQAIQRGIPCTILRFPTLIGHSETGHFTTDTNFIMNFVFTVARMKVFVDIPGGWHSMPVDIAAKISTSIFFNDQAETGLYNIVGNEPMTSEGYTHVAKEMGMAARLVSDKEFIDIINRDKLPLMESFREAFNGRNLLETIKGTSPVFKFALEGSKTIFEKSTKLRNAVRNIEEIIPSPLDTMRRQIKYAISKGIFDQLGIEYRK